MPNYTAYRILSVYLSYPCPIVPQSCEPQRLFPSCAKSKCSSEAVSWAVLLTAAPGTPGSQGCNRQSPQREGTRQAERAPPLTRKIKNPQTIPLHPFPRQAGPNLPHKDGQKLLIEKLKNLTVFGEKRSSRNVSLPLGKATLHSHGNYFI